MIRQAHQLGDGRPPERREGVQRPPAAGREPIRMCALLVERRDADWLDRAIERNPVKIALRRILGRRHEVTLACLLVDAHHANHVKLSACQTARRPVLPREHNLEPSPAVAIGRPGEGASVVEKLQVVVNIDPGLVPIGQDGTDRASAGISEHGRQRVLSPIDLLDEKFGGIRDPLHPDDVVLPWISGNLQPSRRSTGCSNNAHPCGRVLLAGPGIPDRDHLRIEPSRRVQHRIIRHTRRLDLPVGDRVAIGAPAESVVEEQLFFIDPVECAVDAGGRTIRGQRDDGALGNILNVQVVVAHVGRFLSLGIERGEHQGCCRGLAAQLSKRPGIPIEDPVVSPRVQAPHLACIGEEEQSLAVSADGEIGDCQGLFLPLRNELLCLHEDLARTARRVVADDALALPSLAGL